MNTVNKGYGGGPDGTAGFFVFCSCAETSPGDFACRTKNIQPLMIISPDTGGENVTFPGNCRRLTTFQFLKHLLKTCRTFRMIIFHELMPRKQEPHVARRRYQLNFASKL